MKILKIFGVVVGIHVFALILIFVSPGCSATSKTSPSPAEVITKTDDNSATISGASTPVTIVRADAAPGSTPTSFDPNAPAPSVRFSPTRPGTAAAASLEAQPVSDVTPAVTYTVGKGDSLWTIAKKRHLTVAELAAANNMKAGATVRIGQKLIIPGKAVAGAGVGAKGKSVAATSDFASASAPAPKASAESVKHIVKPGETLGAIARKYQVKVGEIATANNISDPAKIRPGMELTIPGWQAPVSKSGHTPAKKSAIDSSQPQPPPAPTTIVPAPDQDLDSGSKSAATEPPVIKVEDSNK